ncbi:hypothetical protein Agub_g4626 [Astrephomene gubernaculifera]|uniref:Cyclic nucleotide-binding domain-containing protein n=1 Tax=Astrephomene gubernaculifera TaxID=47775 RepID=A0AAD3DKF7_9CHLO|nr:hypothetical protein Agub_g4626 [Astrephomene gubernaculifera]
MKPLTNDAPAGSDDKSSRNTESTRDKVQSQVSNRRRTSRISELLLESSNPTKPDQLDDFSGVGVGAPHRRTLDGDALRTESFAAGSVYSACNSMRGSVYGESVAGGNSMRRRSSMGGGAASGAHGHWRKLNSAMVVSKALAGRPRGQFGSRAATQSGRHDPPPSLASLSGKEGVLGLLRILWQNLTARLAILPDTTWYQVYWFYWAVAIALLSCWVEPFHMAFPADGQGWLLAIEYFIIGTFLVDFFLKFYIAYYDPETGLLVTTQPKMGMAYIKSWKFFLDLFGCFPYDSVMTSIAKRYGTSSATLDSMEWLRLLTLARAYRILDLFNMLDYRMLVSQGTLMLLRNYTYVFFTAHWAACIFYHVAQQESNFGPDTWVGRTADAFPSAVYERYILALYYSVTIFTAMGDARMFPFSTVEIALTIVYLLFNLFLAAYIIGTVTIMMVTADEHSKAFRDSVSHLHEYSRDNELPERLYTAMKEHLEVHFDSAQSTDDQVLSIYPTAIRRRVLRHLYLQSIKGCYLFQGCKQRFLDAVLSAARVELFLPGVEILTEGDNVVELLIVVLGEVAVSQGSARMGALYGGGGGGGGTGGLSSVGSERFSVGGSFSHLNESMRRASSGGLFLEGGGGDAGGGGVGGNNGSATPLLSPGGISVGLSPATAMMRGGGGHVTKKSVGDSLSEITFFSDGASYETVVGTTPVRVLSLPKAAWELLVQQFPQQARHVLENVQRAAESAVEENLKAAGARSQLTAEQLHVALSLVSGTGGFAESTDPLLLAQTRDALTHAQLDMITRLDDIRAVVSAHVRKCDEMRTFEFLNTAAQGDVESLSTMLKQGISANTADYDGRTALMLAAAKGFDGAVQLLLDSGADKDKVDAFGISALAEAAKNAHDSIIELMLSYGATLGAGGLTVAAEMCTAVFEGDLVKLRRLLRSGAPPDACDYDQRSALHIAGAEGNLEAVKLLVEEGGADPNFQDRWGNTTLDEARRVGAEDVVAYLEGLLRGGAAMSSEKKRHQEQHDYMTWCGLGNAEQLRQAGGYGFGEEVGCAFTGLMVAASKGHTEAVKVLLAGMPPGTLLTHAHLAMLEAARMGHADTVTAFRTAGVMLRDPRVACARHLLSDLRNAAQQGNGPVVEALLAAGVPGRLEPGSEWTQVQQPADAASALHLATAHSHLGVVRRLLEHGGALPDLTTPDALGRTPLQLADIALAQQPSSLRAKAVCDYLGWAAAEAGRGAGMQQLAAAALERWGAISHHGHGHNESTQGMRTPTPPAILKERDKGSGSPLDSFPGERLLLPQRPPSEQAAPSPSQPTDANGSDRSPVNRLGGTSLRAGAVVGEPQPEDAQEDPVSATVATARLLPVGSTGSGGGGSGGGAGPPAEAAALMASSAVAEAWDNLPGTPGGSTRGSSLAFQALKQLDANAAAGGGGGVEADAALMYRSSVLHSAALLNDPPAALLAAASASLVGGRVPACLSPTGRPNRGTSGNLSSPRLVLPPPSSSGAWPLAGVPEGSVGPPAAAAPFRLDRVPSSNRVHATSLNGGASAFMQAGGLQESAFGAGTWIVDGIAGYGGGRGGGGGGVGGAAAGGSVGGGNRRALGSVQSLIVPRCTPSNPTLRPSRSGVRLNEPDAVEREVGAFVRAPAGSVGGGDSGGIVLASGADVVYGGMAAVPSQRVRLSRGGGGGSGGGATRLSSNGREVLSTAGTNSPATITGVRLSLADASLTPPLSPLSPLR